MKEKLIKIKQLIEMGGGKTLKLNINDFCFQLKYRTWKAHGNKNINKIKFYEISKVQ